MEVIRRMFRCDGHAMEHYFDRIYLSYELRELKPSEAIFRKMIDDSGMVPSETLFIDDARPTSTRPGSWVSGASSSMPTTRLFLRDPQADAALTACLHATCP